MPEDGILHSHRRENLKSYEYIFIKRESKFSNISKTGHVIKIHKSRPCA
jgi:hypothetical protein